MTSPRPDTPSRRERHKQDKRSRIQAAALTLFTAQGYEATTIRQIAAEADVAAGTVFRYATDKADLLLMVFHDVIAHTIEEALAPERLTGPLSQVLPGLFDPFFAFYEARPALASDFLRLVLFHDSPWRVRELEQGHAFVAQLAALLRARQQAGEVTADLDPQTAAFALFSLYQACLVGWLSGGVTLANTRAQLAALLALQWRALQAGAVAGGPA
ncbi:TetR/AcrR family transcriptional regulator [Deinococcus multiflagellatus]|uniref:TetR/AcrR family transcriptional regulator n=1 Tax=Deinococcus multiflagellatus TaxID=1656887 RepID=A0ABW1ZE83_9DEIO|nr:TetR/AcrR family transcriptional regulator [Deinococcus multiflagellatus]MBZ9712887.1 TetR/AcrR family transcriptional regulator [Deinococcus multiflagellatus]